MKALKIVRCSDSMMWYRDQVGSIVPLVRITPDCYMSREPAGYSNIVKLEDAVVVDLQEDIAQQIINTVETTDVKHLVFTTFDKQMAEGIKSAIIKSVKEKHLP